MQPQTPPTKPVMDVAAPPKPTPISQPAQPPVSVITHEPVAVAIEPHLVASAPPAPASLIPAAIDTVPKKPVAVAPTAKRSKTPSGRHTPVALITVTILVMLALSGIAVLVYATSQP